MALPSALDAVPPNSNPEVPEEVPSTKKKLLTAGAGSLGLLGFAAGPVFAVGGSGPAPAPVQQVGGTVRAIIPVSAPAATAPSGKTTTYKAPATGLQSSGVSSSAPRSSPFSSSPSFSSSVSRDSAASTSSPYYPPLHGTNPHGEGTALSVTSEPQSAPQPSNCDSSGSSEIVVVGRSCGQESSGGSYNGHVTVLALGGNELLGENSTSSGTTETGSLAPLLGPVLTGVNGGLSQLCSGTSNNVCLSLLNATSSTSATGSNNSFSAASANVGGTSGISATALSSRGNISQSGTCQNATGSSQVANVSPAGTLLAEVASSKDSSTACQNSSQNSQTHISSVLSGAVSPLTSPILGAACANGTFSQPLAQLPAALVALYCNASDSNGAQASAPYGTSEGLTAILLGGIGQHAPSTESLATAPAAAPAGGAVPLPGSGNGSAPTLGNGGAVLGNGGSPAGPTTGAGDELDSAGSGGAPLASSGSSQLPFTGINLLLELIVAFSLFAAGGVAWLASRRRLA
jgi:hypothetical protein